jgi:hypothetical protein
MRHAAMDEVIDRAFGSWSKIIFVMLLLSPMMCRREVSRKRATPNSIPRFRTLLK